MVKLCDKPHVCSVCFGDINHNLLSDEICKHSITGFTHPHCAMEDRDDHPWTTDLTQYALMLDGKIRIPHLNKTDTICSICHDANLGRIEYYHQKYGHMSKHLLSLLSKETT